MNPHFRQAGSCLLFVLLLVFPAASVSAAVLHVPAGYVTIQAAIDASSHGDEILVASGTYTGAGNRDIDFHGKRILVRSEGGAGATIIDCQGSPSSRHRGFWFRTNETRESVLDGFTIRNGYIGPGSNGGGILCEYASPTVRRCVIELCRVESFGDDGGGINLRNSSGLIEECVVRWNFASYGGGIALRGDTAPLLRDCVIGGNAANYGAGIDAGGIGAPVVENCRIFGNETIGGFEDPGYGGGALLGGNAALIGCFVTGNLSGAGGGIAVFSGTPSIRGCTVAGNRAASADGGGLFVTASACGVSACILRGNCADVGRGGEAFAASGGVVDLRCTILDWSAVVADGGVIHDLGNNIDADPLFCDARPCVEAPTTAGSYDVDRDSPAVPEANPCGTWLGAGAIGCPAADAPDSPPTAGGAGLPFPNPVADRFRVSVPAGSRVALVDAGGREVRSWGSAAGAIEASTEGLAAGVYQLRITRQGHIESRRLVVLRR
jgi:hypothetical protein